MDFFANNLNGGFLRNVLPDHTVDVDFVRVCQANHSTMDHVRRMRLETFGVNGELDSPARGAAFAEWLWGKRNQRGESVVDLLHFVLDGGDASDLPRRIFDAGRSDERKLPHFGINQVAELAGWARPELSPPRNGRTSKGLRALGFDLFRSLPRPTARPRASLLFPRRGFGGAWTECRGIHRRCRAVN